MGIIGPARVGKYLRRPVRPFFFGLTERIVETKLTDLDDRVAQIGCGMRRGYWMARGAGARGGATPVGLSIGSVGKWGAGVFQCNLWNLLGCGGTVHRPQRTNEEDFCLGEIPCPSTSHAVVLLQTQSGA